VYMKKLVKHPLFAGSFIMLAGSNLYNFGQFVYHFLTGRLLGTSLYGEFASVISVLGFIGVIQLSLSLTVVKFIAVEKKQKDIDNITKWIFWWSFLIGAVVSLGLLALSPFLSNFLKFQDSRAMLVLVPVVFFFFMANTARSIFQGLLKFGSFVAVLLSESAVKLILSTILILLGFSVFGATVGLLVGIFVSLLVAYFLLREHLAGGRGGRPDIAPMLRFTGPVFVQGLALTSMYTTDFLLVKHFFSPHAASIYGSLAVLGRVVFFGTSPITQVMFPVVTKKYSHGEKYHNMLFLSLILAASFSLFVTVFYFVVPNFPIIVLYGSEFLGGASILWWFGLFMGLLGLANMLTQFYLSVGKTKVVLLFLSAAILQIILVWMNHTSLETVIQMSVISAAVLLAGLVAYFPFHDHKAKSDR